MTIQQFGATVKQKYPEYKTYSDEEIGKRMLEKYPQYQSQVENPKTNKLPGLLQGGIRLGGNIAGGILGGKVGTTIGEGVGSIAGPGGAAIGAGVGNYGGSIVGGGAGSAGAEGLLSLLDSLINKKPIDLTKPNYGEAFKSGAVGQAVGIPAGKLLGLLAHPITPFTNKATSILENSPGTINFEKLLGQWAPGMKSKFAADTLGREGTQATNKVLANTVSAVSERVPHNPNQVTSILDLLSSKGINQGLQKSVSKYYGKGIGDIPVSQRAEVVARKDLAKTINDAIYSQEPMAGKLNSIASFLHSIENVPGNILDKLPGVGQASKYTGGLGKKALQKAIPYGGGYLNPTISGLLSLFLNTQ